LLPRLLLLVLLLQLLSCRQRRLLLLLQSPQSGRGSQRWLLMSQPGTRWVLGCVEGKPLLRFGSNTTESGYISACYLHGL
jgi:hypothetical protein